MASAQFGGGTGDPNDPYLIADPNHLFALADDPNHYDKHFKLTSDLDLDPYVTGTPPFTTALIAGDQAGSNWAYYGTPFTGIFDGNGHKITNLTIDTGGAANRYLGLFGWIDSGAIITDLGLENASVAGADRSAQIGLLCGVNGEGMITNCYATGSVTAGDFSNNLGGLCGRNLGGTISHCYATATVAGGYHSLFLGGLCGHNKPSAVIADCYATGNVSAGDNSESLGGLCGRNEEGTITDCYATGNVTTANFDSEFLGGLCGMNAQGTITNSYAAGAIQGDHNVGGLCGRNAQGIITNSYATGAIRGDHNVGGLCGANDRREDKGMIANCYATGSVTGGGYDSSLLGGLCGYNHQGTINNCYATGAVQFGDFLGGLCAYNYNGTITNSFWDTDTSGLAISAGGVGKTTAEMQTQTTFTDALWDFYGETVNGSKDIWFMSADYGYPEFSWVVFSQDPTAFLDMLADDIVALKLHAGIENSLLAKVDTAIDKLEDDNDNNDTAAINSLQAFINAVQAQSGKKIHQDDADALIALAQKIIAELSG